MVFYVLYKYANYNRLLLKLVHLSRHSFFLKYYCLYLEAKCSSVEFC